MAFDIEGAKAAGYSDAEIVDHLASQSKFNAGQARKAGYSDAELLQHLGTQTAAPAASAKAPALAPEDTPGVGQTMMIGAGRTFDKVLDGLTQMWMGVSSDSDSTKAALKNSVDEKSRLYQPLAEARPVATAVGESLPSMVVPIGGSATVLGTAAKLAASGAIPAALEYGTPEERLQRAAVAGGASAAGGLIIPKVLQAGTKLVAPLTDAALGVVTPAARALYARAQQLGIPVTAAQLGNSKFMKTLASTIDAVPFSGATASKAAQQQGFNRAVSRTFGEDSPVVTREIYDQAKTRITGEFDRLSSQNNLAVTPALLNDLGQVTTDASRHATDSTARSITNLVDDLAGKIDPTTGTIPGAAYQAIDSKISKLLKAGNEQTPFLQQLQTSIRTAMDHSISPADQAAWQQARAQYRNLKAVRDIVGKGGGEGDISPALLMGRLNANNAGKEAMAQGTRGELGDIAEVGKQFLVDQVPNSGTAQRMAAYGALGAGGAVNPILAAKTIALSRLANVANNSPRVTARMVAPRNPANIQQLLTNNPNVATQVLGSGSGLTLADLAASR